MTKTILRMKPKIFTIWPFTEKTLDVYTPRVSSSGVCHSSRISRYTSGIIPELLFIHSFLFKLYFVLEYSRLTLL